jgi:hypothetical protein
MRLDAFWAATTRSAGDPVLVSAWVAEMADGLIDGWACRFTGAAAELKERFPDGTARDQSIQPASTQTTHSAVPCSRAPSSLNARRRTVPAV